MGSPIEMSGERDALLQLDTELKAMLESLVGQGLPDKDIRASVPAFWRIAVGGVACWESMHRTFNTVEGMPNFRKLGRYSEPFANDRLYALDGTVRCGFLTVFLFQAEVLFNELLRALGETAPNRFQESVKQLLRKLKSPDIDKKLANLKIATTLRNSLHANGIHERADLVADLDGVRFEFREGEPVPT